jgi:hypothetical protein
MIRIGHAELRIGLLAVVAGHHERGDARHVGLEGQREHVEHQGDPIFEPVGNANRRARHRNLRLAMLLGALDPPLDLPDALEVIAESGAIARTQTALQAPGALGDRVENAAVLLDAGRPFSRVAAPAEDPVEDDPRVDLDRERRGGRPP